MLFLTKLHNIYTGFHRIHGIYTLPHQLTFALFFSKVHNIETLPHPGTWHLHSSYSPYQAAQHLHWFHLHACHLHSSSQSYTTFALFLNKLHDIYTLFHQATPHLHSSSQCSRRPLQRRPPPPHPLTHHILPTPQPLLVDRSPFPSKRPLLPIFFNPSTPLSRDLSLFRKTHTPLPPVSPRPPLQRKPLPPYPLTCPHPSTPLCREKTLPAIPSTSFSHPSIPLSRDASPFR
ncbi:unnamed protein product [Acanthosepion pharaonis]|uniref:Uncharacterized protein n=1 Tax=Acanthosepion pharaonis TaxID=158019 RepID=A0A812DF97_ACAPH|nr:unnamed protein product [Sepia pharaonis]